MYPTVVIVLVETQLSMMDVYEISSFSASEPAGQVVFETRLVTLEPISFAVGPLHGGTTDNEAESQRQCTL